MQYFSSSRLLIVYSLVGIFSGNAQIVSMPPSARTSTPLTADMLVITSVSSQYGTVTQTQTGKYYRTSDGATRQDTATNSIVVNPKTGTIISLNHSKKDASSSYLPAPPTSTVSPESGSVPPLRANKPPSEDLGEATISGHLATGKRIVTQNPTGLRLGVMTTEVWTAADVGLPVLMTQKSPVGTTTRRFENIVLGEPDPQLFTIPTGYNVQQQAPVQDVAAGDPPKSQ